MDRRNVMGCTEMECRTIRQGMMLGLPDRSTEQKSSLCALVRVPKCVVKDYIEARRETWR